MKIAADRTVCIGAGMCVVAAPDVYDQDEDGLVMLLAAETDEPAAREAVGLCPSGALRLVEE